MRRYKAVIYKLIDPRNGDVKYIGQTAVKWQVRLSAHICQPHSAKMKKWIGELKSAGLKPVFEIVEDGIHGRQEINEREQYWIAFYRKNSGSLLNGDPSPRF